MNKNEPNINIYRLLISAMILAMLYFKYTAEKQANIFILNILKLISNGKNTYLIELAFFIL